jgi:predicted RNA-binding Zn ribbon-like protein
METSTFDFDSGELCLDFANTLEWHASENPEDRLGDYADFLAWAEAAELLPAERLDRLRRLLSAQSQEAASVHGRAIQLREAIYRIFADVAGERSASLDDLVVINEELNEALYHSQVSPAPQGFSWQWAEVSGRLDQLLWPVVRSAAELLTSDSLDRVKECADDRGCGYLFIDTSRNRSRRWCSMESCGNRAKVRQHRERKRKNA